MAIGDFSKPGYTDSNIQPGKTYLYWVVVWKDKELAKSNIPKLTVPGAKPSEPAKPGTNDPTKPGDGTGTKPTDPTKPGDGTGTNPPTDPTDPGDDTEPTIPPIPDPTAPTQPGNGGGTNNGGGNTTQPNPNSGQ